MMLFLFNVQLRNNKYDDDDDDDDEGMVSAPLSRCLAHVVHKFVGIFLVNN